MIGPIEDAIIARIKFLSDSGALGYQLREIKTYGGELRSQQDRAKIVDFPAVWLAFDGASENQAMNGYTRFQANFVLLVGTRNLRNEKAARHGAAGAVGAYQIATDLVGVFAGKKLEGLEGVENVRNLRIQPVSVEDKKNGRVAVYAISFAINFKVQHVSPDVSVENALTAIHTNWDLPPNGEVGESLPDDENADATSHVTGD